MGNYLFRPNLEEKLCESCYSDYRNSQWVSHGRCRSCGPESIPEVAERGHPVCLQALIQAQAVVGKDQLQSVYQIALEYAAAKGNIACAEIMLEAGADVNGSGSFGRPLIEAIKGGHRECVEFLLSKGVDVNGKKLCRPLIEAVKGDHQQSSEFLLSKGADVNVDEHSGRTALNSAAHCGRLSCLEVLIKAGADVNSIQDNGNTALMEAVKSGNRNCIVLLLNGGADVHLENVYGDIALTTAAKTKVGCYSFGPLVAAGADVNIRDVFGTPVIVDAALKCSDKELQILVDAGADVNATDKEGNTPLIITSGRSVPGRVECLKVLLISGAKVNLLNNKKLNALCHHINKSKYWNKPPDRTMVLLLYAAGETLDGITIDEDDESARCVLDYLDKREIRLKSLCRETIRKHLIELNFHRCLFNKIPQLGLPTLMTRYLLYNMTLDTKCSQPNLDV